MTREELFQWVKQEYGTEAEYPWKDSNAVLRRADNNKWYGVILSVAGSKLGLEDDNIIDVINLKSDPMLIGSLAGAERIFSGIPYEQGEVDQCSAGGCGAG